MPGGPVAAASRDRPAALPWFEAAGYSLLMQNSERQSRAGMNMADPLPSQPWQRPGFSAEALDLEVARHLGGRSLPEVADSGAMGVNITWERTGRGRMRISHQHRAEKLIRAGILRGERGILASGIRALAWAFAQQAADGGFPDTARGGHSTAFLVAAASHSECLLRASPYAGEELEARGRILAGLEAAAAWFTGPEWADYWQQNRGVLHQAWLLAAGFANLHHLRANPVAMARSHELVDYALQTQAAEGYYPERGGPDTNYNAGSLFWAQRWLMRCPGDSRALAVRDSIGRSIAWQRGRIDTTGRLDGSANTRTGPASAEGRLRPEKGLGYGNTARALASWALMTGQADPFTLPRLVLRAGRLDRPRIEGAG